MMYTRRGSVGTPLHGLFGTRSVPTSLRFLLLHGGSHRLAATVLVAGSLLGTACAGGDPGADLILTNAAVYTLAWEGPGREGLPSPDAPYAEATGWHPDAEAVAIRDGRIVFVGSSADAEAHRSATTRVMDLAGATVIPGLIESHVHIVQLGASLSQIDLVGVETEEEAVELAAEAAARTPEGSWVLGSGWDEGAWANNYPTLELLSERVPAHPVYLRSLHGFAGWGNRLALEAAGITAGTPSPSGGEIIKDAQGNPTGVVLNQAVNLLDAAVRPPSVETVMDQTEAALRVMAEAGYVAVHEAGAPSLSMAAFEELEAAGRLPIRVYAMLATRDPELCETWLERGPDTDTESMLRTRSVKAFYDAALGSRGARMLDDYSDRPGHRGTSGSEYGFDQELVARMIAAGFQAEIHAIGDAGNRETLDFYDRVLMEHPETRTLRHKIVHAQVVHPDDFARFASLGLLASMQPPHAVEDMPWAENRVGPERIRGAYAWRTMRRHGVRLLFNSDLPGSDWDVFYGLHSAITRRNKDLEPEGGWYPEQNMTPEEAIRGYTEWGAYAEFMENETGVIREGFRGDLTVLDIDPFVVGSTDPDRLLNGRILATIVGGEVVFEAGR